ncbi:MAG TPA: PadR family transcriptional regulator [Solirubrobacteraceae bacterium]|jgi:DNA-binding PadR family transcriptional regulator
MASAQPLPDQPELTPTGRVIVGLLAMGSRTGYDIKQVVDNSTRFFWAASYGQIYPELKRLEQQGLVRGRSEPTGGRARQVYEITEAGLAALQTWLESGQEPVYEVRDEGMLKLFFSSLTSPAQGVANIRAMRERHEHKLAALRGLEAKGITGGAGRTLALGITLTQCYVDWCAEAERRLTADAEKE